MLMAILRGRGRDSINFRPLDRWLDIAPVPPTSDGVGDEYRVAMGPDWSGARIIEFRRSVQGFQFNYSTFEAFADTFCRVDDLLAFKKAVPNRLVPVVASDAFWLSVYLSDLSSRRAPEQIGVDVYYSLEDDLRPEQTTFKLFHFLTSAGDARRFGRELLVEIEEALRARQRLGRLSGEDEDILHRLDGES